MRPNLFWKYAAYFSALVSALLIVSGAVGGYFAYRQSVAALDALQRAKVHFAATEIANFMRRNQDAVRAAVTKFNTIEGVGVDDLRMELVAMLRHHPSISELHWIGADGKERFGLARLWIADNGADWSADPRFLGARAASNYVGPVYFQRDSEPYVSIAAAPVDTGAVLDAEVNLKDLWDLISQVIVAPAGAVYVVDGGGQLISHPDIALVLAKTNLAKLPHVQRALDKSSTQIEPIGDARNVNGVAVISTAVSLDQLGWTIFAEQPRAEALRPVYASVAQSVALILLGLVAAVAASLLLARRMVRPIREIEQRARQLAEGQFEFGKTPPGGDELGALASQFDRMAARLQEIYSTQETRIAERTRELASANEAKTRFLAAASHDLRQPIHALALFVGQLGASGISGDGRALVQKIETSVEALLTLLDALLDLSKLDVGAVTPALTPVALDELLSRLAAEFTPTAEAKGLALTFVRTSLWVRSDPLLLGRILQNVVANAVRFTDDGRILIGCRRRGESVELIVADTGIGIDPGHLPNVFQEFYRAAPGRHEASTGPGLGLGLAIVRRLAALLDHRVSIESIVGKGTVVRILVPREQPQLRVSAAAPNVVESLRGIRVLIIDDEASARDAMAGLLVQWGCEVLTAGSGDEAVERALARSPDIALCDLRLADEENGVDVVARIRRECGATFACAFVTGESAPDRIAEARATGHPVAFKPTSPVRLRAILEHLVHSQ